MGSNDDEQLIAENRRHTRVETCNLISFLSTDADGRVLRQGMGKALDISRNGMLLESALPVETEFVSLMSTDPDDQLIEITAQVAYSRRSRTGSYLIGMRFSAPDEDNIRFAAGLIKTFHYRRKKSGAPEPTAG
jgi:hypothetical protein